MHINSMKLFHGSPISGIGSFQEAEESTVGKGVYLTSQKEAACGYAIVRSKKSEDQFIYEAEIENMNILNLSSKEAIFEFSKYFRQELILLKKHVIEEKGELDWLMNGIFDTTFKELDKLSTDKPVGLKNIVWHFQDLTRKVLLKQGFNGLMTIEGGESGNGVTIGDHDSYVIFQPEKAKIIREEKTLNN